MLGWGWTCRPPLYCADDTTPHATPHAIRTSDEVGLCSRSDEDEDEDATNTNNVGPADTIDAVGLCSRSTIEMDSLIVGLLGWGYT
jgi:hypothetical protein